MFCHLADCSTQTEVCVRGSRSVGIQTDNMVNGMLHHFLSRCFNVESELIELILSYLDSVYPTST